MYRSRYGSIYVCIQTHTHIYIYIYIYVYTCLGMSSELLVLRASQDSSIDRRTLPTLVVRF